MSDLHRMGEWSPQCRKMFIRGGEVKAGTRTLNINRQSWKVWPTRATVIDFEPEQRLSFAIKENGTLWSFDLEPTESGTKVTEARTTPRGVSGLSNFLTKNVLGGTQEFESDLERGIDETLRRIKTEVERAA